MHLLHRCSPICTRIKVQTNKITFYLMHHCLLWLVFELIITYLDHKTDISFTVRLVLNGILRKTKLNIVCNYCRFFGVSLASGRACFRIYFIFLAATVVQCVAAVIGLSLSLSQTHVRTHSVHSHGAEYIIF